jgi:hypothetical protein
MQFHCIGEQTTPKSIVLSGASNTSQLKENLK